MAEWIWLACLCVTHGVAYWMGRNDFNPSEDAFVEIKRYEIDKKYEHLRYLTERRENHERQ